MSGNLVALAFFSPALRDALITAIEETGDVDAAAELVGSSRGELNAAMRKDAELAKDVTAAGLKFKRSLVATVSEAATKLKDVKAAQWLLERIDPAFAPPKQRLDVRVQRFDKLSDEELMRLAQGEDTIDAESE